MIRLFFPDRLPDHGEVALPPEQAHHIARVLRLNAGERITLFDGNGGEYPAVIARIDKASVVVHVGERALVDRESPLAITLAQAVSSGERMDYTVQKAVELGVTRIEPLLSVRCVVRLSGERAAKRVAHWQAVAIAACEQCGRNRIPAVTALAALPQWLSRLTLQPAGHRLLLAPHARAPLREMSPAGAPLILLAGPEGGFSPDEEAMAQRAGFVPVRLGPRVLRTETAAIAAIAALQALWGDF